MMTQSFSLIDIFTEPTGAIEIRKEPTGDFGDDPDSLRWRAWWSKSVFGDGGVNGIELKCYPVVRLTPAGAWIDPEAYRCDGVWSPPYKELLRWVSNEGGAAWAKRTQEEALQSLAIRYERWSNRILGDIEYFLGATKALKSLIPARAKSADDGMKRLREYVEGRTA